MFSKCLIAGVASFAAAQDVTMFLDDSYAANMFTEEKNFEAGIRKVMQVQTAELEKMAASHPQSLLLQTEIATQKVESLADTINFAADTTKSADGINACNYARAGALEAYANVDRILGGLGGAVGSACAGGSSSPACAYPHSGYQSLSAQADQLWEAVKATTKRCRIIGSPAVLGA